MSIPNVDLGSHFEILGSAENFVDEIHDVLAHTHFLDALNLEETRLLCTFMNCYAAPRGSELTHEGENGDDLVILLTGRAEIFVSDSRGQSCKVATIGPGTTVGEMSMIDGNPRTVTCISTEPVDFLLLKREALRDILITLPRLGNKLLLLLLRVMAERLRQANMDLLLATSSAN